MAGSQIQALALALHSLGYAAPVPSDLHQHPDFEFVADCFAWLCQRIDPEVTAPRDYATEQKRAAFLSALGSQLFARTRIKVDLRRLYRACGGAAKELLSLASVLQQAAQRGSAGKAAGAVATPPNYVAQLLASRTADRAKAQQLAQGIAAAGAQLLGTLAQAPAITQQLEAATSAGSDVASLKQGVQAAMGRARAQIAALQKAIAELDQEQQSLEAKVEKRHVELDRLERRLDALHGIRPMQSEEVDRLEMELAELHRAYLRKFRNLEYLEGQLDRYNALQEAKAEEADTAMRKIQRQMREEEARVLAGDQNGDPNHFASDDSEADFASFEPKALPRLGPAGPGPRTSADHLLLVPDDSLSSNPGRGGSARASGSSYAGGPGAASLRPSSASGKRPSSAAAQRARGSGTAGTSADMLLVEEMQRLGVKDSRSGGLPLQVDNDF